MRPVSKKRQQRIRETQGLRRDLRESVGGCEICGHSPSLPWRDKPFDCSSLVCHEISCGPLRDKSLDKPYCILVLCSFCNQHVVTNTKEWPESRQLAALARSRPATFDLTAYLELTSPRAMRRIEIHEVLEWMEEEYLTKSDVAAKMQVDRRSVNNWIESGELPAIDARTAGATRPLYRVAWSDYLAFCKARMVSA